jgi:hypothetical protein
MNIDILRFGATGMVGRWCSASAWVDAWVGHVLAVGRSRSVQRHARLSTLVLRDNPRADLHRPSVPSVYSPTMDPESLRVCPT